MKVILTFLVLSMCIVGCDDRTKSEIKRDKIIATKQVAIEQDIENKRRYKIVNCSHEFQSLGNWGNSAIICPNCGVKQGKWESGDF